MKRLTAAAAAMLLTLTGCTAELGDGEVTDSGALDDTSKRVGSFEPWWWDSHTVGIPAWLLPE